MPKSSTRKILHVVFPRVSHAWIYSLLNQGPTCIFDMICVESHCSAFFARYSGLMYTGTLSAAVGFISEVSRSFTRTYQARSIRIQTLERHLTMVKLGQVPFQKPDSH